jgi:hypothetical protein
MNIKLLITTNINIMEECKMNNQYIDNSTGEEQSKGFNKTGVLLLKNRIDNIEYHLYNNKLRLPESEDINETLQIHLYNVIKKPIHISISSNNGTIFSGNGRLLRRFEHDVEKFFLLESDTYCIGDKSEIEIDLEEILFNVTEQTLNIKIHTIHNKATDEAMEGANNADGLQES